MDQESVAATTGEGQNGAATPDGYQDGLVQLRRQSDWTGQPRTDDDAAASAYRAALDVATATLAAYDGGTAAHSDDVVTLCLALAEQLGVLDRDRVYLLAAAELHDIGKVGVSTEILSKPAALDPREWEIVRGHTLTGERILSAVPELAEVAWLVRHCHERWDGGGYPDGLSGEQIPLAARIVFCADAFHAIRGDRPYRRGRSADAALAEVQKHSGTQFDPAVVTALVAVATQLGERRRRGLGVYIGGRRSQRLAALLLTLAVSGSALAATGIWNPVGGRASTQAGERPAPSLPQITKQAAGGAAAREERRAAAERDRRGEAQSRSAARTGPASGGRFRELEGSAPGAPRGETDTPSAAPDRPPLSPSPRNGESGPTDPPALSPGQPGKTETVAPVPGSAPAPVVPLPVPVAPQGDEDDDGDDDDDRGDDDGDDRGDDDDDDDDEGGRGHHGHGNGHDKGHGEGHRHHDD